MGVFSTDAPFKHALEGAPEASPEVAYASLRPEALGLLERFAFEHDGYVFDSISRSSPRQYWACLRSLL